MARQQIRRHWGDYLREAVGFWLGLADDDVGNARRQMERIVDCVCDRHDVPRNVVELEIYEGLLRLTAAHSHAPSNQRHAP